MNYLVDMDDERRSLIEEACCVCTAALWVCFYAGLHWVLHPVMHLSALGQPPDHTSRAHEGGLSSPGPLSLLPVRLLGAGRVGEGRALV